MNQSTKQSNIDWAEHIKVQQDSELSAKAYCCAKHTLNYDQFGYYKRSFQVSVIAQLKKRTDLLQEIVNSIEAR